MRILETQIWKELGCKEQYGEGQKRKGRILKKPDVRERIFREQDYGRGSKMKLPDKLPKLFLKRPNSKELICIATALEGLDFRGANLNGTNLRNNQLHLGADFRGANFKGTNLQDSSVQGADFREAKNLNEAKWEEAEYSVNTKFPDGFNPKEHGMRLDLNGADLRGQYVGDLDFENAKFYNLANLEGATYKLGQKFPEGFFDPIEHKMVMDLKKIKY